MIKTASNIKLRLKEMLRELRLPVIRESYEELAKAMSYNTCKSNLEKVMPACRQGRV